MVNKIFSSVNKAANPTGSAAEPGTISRSELPLPAEEEQVAALSLSSPWEF